jgi:hypothetical protein
MQALGVRGIILRKTLVVCFALLLVGLVGSAAFAQIPPEKKTVFIIADKDGFGKFPMQAYAIDGDELVFADQWQATYRGIGPVGLAVDETNKNLFVSYESSRKIEVFNAASAKHVGSITLVGTSNLAGMVVHEGRNQLFVVDRGDPEVFVFDTTTFTLIESWVLPTGNGPWGIDLQGDELFTADASPVIRWYNIDTQTATGNVTLPENQTNVEVTDYPELTIYADSAWDHNKIYKHTVGTGVTEFAVTGDNGMGIATNPGGGVIYHVVGHPNSAVLGLYVMDAETLAVIHRYNMPQSGWNPTDCVASFVQFGGTVEKTSTSHPNGVIGVGKQVTFEITVENRASKPIHVLPLKDTYDNTQIQFISATPAPDDNIDDGELDWSDLIATFGADLAQGESYTIEAIFMAEPDICETFVEGVNVAQMIGALDIDGIALEDAAGTFSYKINCYCRTDAECDDEQYCNGLEYCSEEGECVSPGNPCPIDDGLFCNGIEVTACDEVLDECEHYAPPCEDDGVHCNGTESCDEEADNCASTGNPCDDDGEYCNGHEMCDEKADMCTSSGDPCPPNRECSEASDSCKDIGGSGGDDDDDTLGDDEDDGDTEYWPEGQVTGGCCSC